MTQGKMFIANDGKDERSEKEVGLMNCGFCGDIWRVQGVPHRESSLIVQGNDEDSTIALPSIRSIMELKLIL